MHTNEVHLSISRNEPFKFYDLSNLIRQISQVNEPKLKLDHSCSSNSKFLWDCQNHVYSIHIFWASDLQVFFKWSSIYSRVLQEWKWLWHSYKSFYMTAKVIFTLQNNLKGIDKEGMNTLKLKYVDNRTYTFCLIFLTRNKNWLPGLEKKLWMSSKNELSRI